jgi:Bifunctional DNA primase/polymerase, N-terminal
MRPSDWLRAAAVTYACLGYRVLPLHHPIPYSAAQGSTMCCSCGDPACEAVGKHPLTQHGLKDASSDPAQLTGWRRWPQANIGLVTGELADVLDVDGRPGRMALRRLAADHDLRLEGPLAETGSGWHLYLAPTGSGTTELGISLPATAGAGACGGAGLSAGQVVRSRSKNRR